MYSSVTAALLVPLMKWLSISVIAIPTGQGYCYSIRSVVVVSMASVNLVLKEQWIIARVYNREGGRVSYFTMVLCYNTLLDS